jgi:hypothetical protein
VDNGRLEIRNWHESRKIQEGRKGSRVARLTLTRSATTLTNIAVLPKYAGNDCMGNYSIHNSAYLGEILFVSQIVTSVKVLPENLHYYLVVLEIALK